MGGFIPINKRPYRTFLSHAHVDNKVVDEVYRWCSENAGIKVWYDAIEYPVGLIATTLGKEIQKCKSGLIILSESSVRSGWVEEEFNVLANEKNKYRDFEIILIRIDNCEPPAMLSSRKWIQLGEDGFNVAAAVALLEAIHWNETDISTVGRPQIYLSRGSRADEVELADKITSALRDQGYRVVRDAPDHDRFQNDRIQAIIAGCNGYMALLTDRGSGSVSKYILTEMELAREVGIPRAIICEETIAESYQKIHSDETLRFSCGATREIDTSVFIAKFSDNLVEPEHRPYCFFGHMFGEDEEIWKLGRRIIQIVSGLQCVTGDQIFGDNIQSQIVDMIAHATFSIFDISEDRLNSCIEAGVALGTGGHFELICKGPRRRPPFLFRNRQVYFYESPMEFIGLMRRLALPFRRVVA